MIGLLALVTLGFFLGMRHATDPDHVIAVTTIVSRHRTVRGAAAIGAVWGLGHTLTILVVGGGIVLFRWVIPARLGLSMEFAVGVMLVVLGLANLRSFRGLVGGLAPGSAGSRAGTGGGAGPGTVHSHAHSHGDYVHVHPHGHDPEVHPHAPEATPLARLDRRLGGLGPYQLLRPLVVGVVHGLAGSAAVALLVLATIADPRWSVLYLLVFGVGTIVGMMLITAAIAVPIAAGGRRSAALAHRIRLASGMVSLAVGLLIAYRIGFVDGLFTGAPRWAPH